MNTYLLSRYGVRWVGICATAFMLLPTMVATSYAQDEVEEESQGIEVLIRNRNQTSSDIAGHASRCFGSDC